MIELKEVTKEYSKGIAALNGVNLKVEKGEFVFIVGDSGSGKSTLIRLIMKELDPTVRNHHCQRSESEPDETPEDSHVPEKTGSCIPGFPSFEGQEYL